MRKRLRPNIECSEESLSLRETCLTIQSSNIRLDRYFFLFAPTPKNAPGFETICGFCSVLLAQPYPTNIINPDLESRNFRFLLFIFVPSAFHCLPLIDPHDTRLIKSLSRFLQLLPCKTPYSRQDHDSHQQHPLCDQYQPQL